MRKLGSLRKIKRSSTRLFRVWQGLFPKTVDPACHRPFRSDEDSRVKAEKLKEKSLELAELRKKLEDADADIVAKDADIVEKVAEIENLKGLIKVLPFSLFLIKFCVFVTYFFFLGGKWDNRSSKQWAWRKNRWTEVGDEEVDWDQCWTLKGDSQWQWWWWWWWG